MKKKILFVAAMLTAFLFPTTTLEAQPGERSLNRRYQNEIRDSLAQVVHNRQVQMQRYAEQTLATLPNERKLYDENYISVTAELIDTTYADGDLHLDLLYRLSYNCRHLEGYTDDYPLGAYDVEASNSCMAICDLTKHFIEKVMGDLFTQGTEALITITSSADGTEIVSSLMAQGISQRSIAILVRPSIPFLNDSLLAIERFWEIFWVIFSALRPLFIAVP